MKHRGDDRRGDASPFNRESPGDEIGRDCDHRVEYSRCDENGLRDELLRWAPEADDQRGRRNELVEQRAELALGCPVR
jgi:hypothetical protein